MKFAIVAETVEVVKKLRGTKLGQEYPLVSLDAESHSLSILVKFMVPRTNYTYFKSLEKLYKANGSTKGQSFFR